MKRLTIFILITALLISLTFPSIVSAQVDKAKPSQAKNVELVKKVTLRGPQARGGKKIRDTAKGELGLLCSGDRYAILIGIEDYPGDANDLDWSNDDVDDMKNVLDNIYTFDNVYTLKDEGATIDAIYDNIDLVKGMADEDDEVLFFFSGHGARGRANDGDKEKIDESIVVYDGLIWDGDLENWFSDFNTSRIVFIFDSCLSGGMTDLEATGRVICMSATESGTAYEFDALENGQFTYYFVDEGMNLYLADKYDHDDNLSTHDVTIEEAYDYTKVNCIWQRPVISDSVPYDLLP
jgi:hypothetical protein